MSYAIPKLKCCDSPEEAITALADSSLGAETVLNRILVDGSWIDPTNHLGGSKGAFYLLDGLDIYGDQIVRLYEGVAKSDLVTLMALLRATQLSIISGSDLRIAIKLGTSTVGSEEVADIPRQVKELVPSFGRPPEEKRGEKVEELLSMVLGKIFSRRAAARSAETTTGATETGSNEAELQAALLDKTREALSAAMPGVQIEVVVMGTEAAPAPEATPA